MATQLQNPLIYFVSGMWCSSCAKSVREAVVKVDGVKSAEINYASKLLLVEVLEPIILQNIDDSIQNKIKQIGFGVKRQTEGWLSGFKEDLEKEADNKISWLLVSIVWFLAMWSSMIAFAGYSGGGLTQSEIYYITVGSSVFGFPAILIGIYLYAISGLRSLIFSRLFTLDLFIFFGGLSATTVSLIYLLSGRALSYADSGSMIIALLLLTKKIENTVIGKTTASILFQLHPSKNKVQVFKNNEWKPADFHQVKKDQLVRIQATETVPFDGVLDSTDGKINNHLLSGEATSISLIKGDHIFAGAIAYSELRIKVTNPQGNRKIDDWAQEALVSKNRDSFYSRIFSKIENSLTIIAFSGALLLALIQRSNGADIKSTVEAFFVGVLIFCPCLFASIIPLSKQMAHLALLKIGVMLYRSEALLDLSHIKNFYFDKTGTLEAVESYYHSFKETELINFYLNELSEMTRHPIMRGLPKFKLQNNETYIQRVEEIPGQGVFAYTKNNDLLVVGNKKFLESEGIEVESSLENKGTFVALNCETIGQIISKKSYDDKSLEFLNKLKLAFPKSGIEILSGDPSSEGERFYNKIDSKIKYSRGLSPEDKASHIKTKSAFIGDGLNDTLALAKADVSFRLGHRILGYGPVDIEIQVPDINLILKTLIYAKRYRSILIQTAGAALLYNIVALSLAVMDKFSPLGAVLAMITSFLILLLSSLRLLRIPEVKK